MCHDMFVQHFVRLDVLLYQLINEYGITEVAVLCPATKTWLTVNHYTSSLHVAHGRVCPSTNRVT